MRSSIFFLFPLVVFYYSNQQPKSDHEKTFYYFCDSHSKYPSTVIGVQTILYTDVSKIICVEKDLSIQTSKWASLVEKNCQNAKGCTSDLNYYYAEDEAKAQFKKMKEHYKDEKKFILKKLSFD